MANTTNPRRNAEGYPDPTAYEALKNIDREEAAYTVLLVRVGWL